ncbi:MAG: TolC family protein [Flavipsychrobacter sp.]|nr:TolC family protein [Flavipsychrobacter sp.]
MHKNTVTSILLAIAAYNAGAQTTFSSVEDVWKYAETHNVSINNATLEAQKAKRGTQQAYMAFLPSVNTSANFTDNTTIQTTLIPAVIFGGPDGVYKPVQFGQKYNYNAGITAQLDLVNLQTWHNARIAHETEAVNQAQVANTRRNTYQQLAGQYYACLLNKEALRLANRSAAVADSMVTAVTNKFNEGTVNQPNLDNAKLNSERAHQTVVTASYQYRTSLNSLRSLLGFELTDSLLIAGDLKPAQKTAFTGFTEDPSVSLAYHQSQLNLDKLKASNAGIFPTLSLQYSTNTQQFDNTFRPFDAAGPQWYKANFWTLKASWAIFNGGNRWLQSQRNRISYQQATADLEQARRQSVITDENLRLSYNKAAELLTRSQNIMDLSYDNYRHTTLRYEEGIASLEDRLRAFSDFINYQNQYLNSLSEMLIQTYNIKIRQQTF